MADINRNKLIDDIYHQLNGTCSKRQIAKILAWVFSNIVNYVSERKDVLITGFGTFECKEYITNNKREFKLVYTMARSIMKNFSKRAAFSKDRSKNYE